MAKPQPHQAAGRALNQETCGFDLLPEPHFVCLPVSWTAKPGKTARLSKFCEAFLAEGEKPTSRQRRGKVLVHKSE